MSEEEIGLKLPTKEFIMSMEVGDFLVLEGQKFKLQAYVQESTDTKKWYFSRDKTAEELAVESDSYYEWVDVRSNRHADLFIATFDKGVLAEIISTGQYMIV